MCLLHSDPILPVFRILVQYRAIGSPGPKSHMSLTIKGIIQYLPPKAIMKSELLPGMVVNFRADLPPMVKSTICIQ